MSPTRSWRAGWARPVPWWRRWCCCCTWRTCPRRGGRGQGGRGGGATGGGDAPVYFERNARWVLVSGRREAVEGRGADPEGARGRQPARAVPGAGAGPEGVGGREDGEGSRAGAGAAGGLRAPVEHEEPPTATGGRPTVSYAWRRPRAADAAGGRSTKLTNPPRVGVCRFCRWIRERARGNKAARGPGAPAGGGGAVSGGNPPAAADVLGAAAGRRRRGPGEAAGGPARG